MAAGRAIGNVARERLLSGRGHDDRVSFLPIRQGLRSHAERGASILRALDRDDAVALSVLYHHEHGDGNGYFGRRGEEIPLHARILAVADAYDAMTTSLTRKPLTGEAAM